MHPTSPLSNPSTNDAPIDDDPTTNALFDELTLLTSIYPELTLPNPQNPDTLIFNSPTGTLTLRLPPTYPTVTKPTVLTAHLRPSSTDVRDQIRAIIDNQTEGEECLDVIIQHFVELAENETATHPTNDQTGKDVDESQEGDLTVVIWLHHLLATSKRKLALHPSSQPSHPSSTKRTTHSSTTSDHVPSNTQYQPSSTSTINGITKPGHPGILIFSGLASAVRAHINELKAQRWQAFQVRLEAEERWGFAHDGIREVGTMGEVVEAVGERRGDVVSALGIA